MLSEEEELLKPVIQINCWSRGTESCDWAAMLNSNVSQWPKNHNCKIKDSNYPEECLPV